MVERWALDRRALTVALALALFAGSLGLTAVIPKGFFPNSNEALAQLSITLPPSVAIGLVYLIMVILFRSLLVPFVILFSLPLAVIGALVGLAVTGRQLDMSALIGFLPAHAQREAPATPTGR